MPFPRPWMTRLRQIQRSSGWPCGDALEVELLAAGLMLAERDSLGRESLRLTDLGLQVLAASLQANRARRDAHEALVERMAGLMHREGRLVWRGPLKTACAAGWWACPTSSACAIPPARTTSSRSRMKSRSAAPTCWTTCAAPTSAPPTWRCRSSCTTCSGGMPGAGRSPVPRNCRPSAA